MATIADFRNRNFNLILIDKCGKYLGKEAYCLLYSIENIFRIIIHSVLTIQINKDNWWFSVADKDMMAEANKNKQKYVAEFPDIKIGMHEIYHVNLSHLKSILEKQSFAFLPILKEKKQLLSECINLLKIIISPRNKIAHMNFITNQQIKNAETLLKKSKLLLSILDEHIKMRIP
jgi:hypothetical protein